ncbi:MAG: hypothetical protein ABI333_17430 [bacterium]
MRPLLCGLTAALLACGSCGDEDSPRCSADVLLQFQSVSETEQSGFTISEVVFSVEAGYVRGFVDGTARVLLLLDARMTIAPPCGAVEVELVLDQTEFGLQVELHDTESGEAPPFYSESSSVAVGLEPEVYPYQRWTISASQGKLIRRLTVSNEGPSDPPLSTLIKSLTFR